MLGWARRLYDPHPSHLVMGGKDAATSKSGVRESMTQGNSHGSDAAEQSSSMVGLRTMVMLAFLIAIPLMAVIGAGFTGSAVGACSPRITFITFFAGRAGISFFTGSY